MRFNNAFSKSVILILASAALVACGDDDDKAGKDDPKQDDNKVQKLDHLKELTKFEQPPASKVLSAQNPAAKIADGVDKKKLAESKAIGTDKEGSILQYDDQIINTMDKRIVLKDDTLFKMVTALGKSVVHDAPVKEVRFIYNTPYVLVNSRFRQLEMNQVFHMFDVAQINGMFTPEDAVAKAKKAGGKIEYEGVAWYQNTKPGVLSYGKLAYGIDMGKMEGSGKITGVEGLRDFMTQGDKYVHGDVGAWYENLKEVELGPVSFDKRQKAGGMFTSDYNGGKGDAILKSAEGGEDIKVYYLIGAAGPNMEQVVGSVAYPAHGGDKGLLPFVGMKK